MFQFRRTALAVVAITVGCTASGLAKRASGIPVSDVEALYEAVNNAAHAGATVRLSAGHYALTAVDPSGAPRPNGGRLELQPDMSLSGASGHPEDVVIDASGPQGPSFAGPQGNTGAIRVGRSHESVEWLTVRGAATAAAGITTDLVRDSTTSLRIAHVIAEGSIRGIDVRNLGPTSAGRTVIIDLQDNELRDNTAGTGLGIRFVNGNGAHGAAISASLRGNNFHDNLSGCVVANLVSSGASIAIDSHGDHFDRNRVGCVVLGGITLAATGVANDNTISFTAHASSFTDNFGLLPPDGDMGGLVVVGGLSSVAGGASRNSVQVSIWGTTFRGNQSADVSAWGARSTSAAPAGADNTVSIELNGVSKDAITEATPSAPIEPAGTNRVTIVK